MTKETVIVGLPRGMESRPVAILVQIASQYQAKIYLECGNRRVNAKSIMGMMALGLAPGSEIKVTASGEDEKSAVEAIEKYLKNNS